MIGRRVLVFPILIVLILSIFGISYGQYGEKDTVVTKPGLRFEDVELSDTTTVRVYCMMDILPQSFLNRDTVYVICLGPKSSSINSLTTPTPTPQVLDIRFVGPRTIRKYKCSQGSLIRAIKDTIWVEISCGHPGGTATRTPTGTPVATSTGTVLPPPTVTRTRTPTGTPTRTSTSIPTQTPTQTPTWTPTLTPVGTFAIQTPTPVAGGLCATHDDTKWHGWTGTAGCRYTHTHGDNPLDPAIVAIFGGVWPDPNQEISYPWQTNHENMNKHNGYYNINITQFPAGANALNWVGRTANYIKAGRFQFHFHTYLDHAVQVHSYKMEVLVCTLNDSQCGIVRTGGHWHTGVVHCPYKTAYCPLPSDAPVPPNLWLPGTGMDTSGKSIDPYRGHFRTCNQIWSNLAANPDGWNEGAGMLYDDTTRDNPIFWTSGYRVYGDYGWLSQLGVASFDEAVCIDTNTNPASFHLTCDQAPNGAACRFDGTELSLLNAGVLINSSVRNVAFTEVTGKPSTSCTVMGTNCVPLVIQPGVPDGWAGYNFSDIPPGSPSKADNGKVPETFKSWDHP